MKLLNGLELASYIKQRHITQSRRLLHSQITPKLAIIQMKVDPIIDLYIRLKQGYGADIGAEVEIHKSKPDEVRDLINDLNGNKKVHGIIIQLPLPNPKDTDKIVNRVAPEKDVDALGIKSNFQPATPLAITWLLAAYNIDLKNKKVLLIGKGKLVGAPLEKILKLSGVDVDVVEKGFENLAKLAKASDVIISAANEPAVLTAEMIKPGAVIVDAGVAEENGKTVGNVSDDVYYRDDITITPRKGGVGPLTVSALFENLLLAAQNNTK